MSFNQYTRLIDLVNYSTDKIAVNELNINNYVSTENLLPNFGSKIEASSLPTISKVTKYSKGDILVSNIRPYFKKIWYAREIGGASNDVIVFRPKKGIDSVFLYYNLASDKFFNYVMSGAKGTKMPRGDKSHINGFLIPDMPVIEQQSIAHILSTLDEKINVNNIINKTLERMAQEIFKRWFVDFEFPNEDGEPYKSSGGEMVESELGLIPKGWIVMTLKDFADITMGQSPQGHTLNENSVGEVFYQGRTDFNFRFPSRRIYTTEPKRFAKEDDVLLSVRAPVGDINVANEKCCIGRGLAAVSSKNNLNSYLLYLLKTSDKYFNVYNGTGTVFGSINQNDLKYLKYVISPDYIIEERFSNVAMSIDSQIKNLEKQSRTIREVRDTLLPVLMSGEIKVPIEES